MPLVYACSGCSSSAQAANQIAIWLDRERVADMSCIAGVGGNVKTLVNEARKAAAIIAIDGCPLHCAKACLAERGLAPTRHFDLSLMGAKREKHRDFDLAQTRRLCERVKKEIVKRFPAK